MMKGAESLDAAELLETVGDAAFGQIVGRHLYQHLVAGEHADAVLAHASRRVGNNFMLVLELDAEGGVGEQFRHDTRKFQKFFLRHSLSGSYYAIQDLCDGLDPRQAKIRAEPSG